METLQVKTISDFRNLIQGIEKYSGKPTELVISESAYVELNRTYVALGKCNVQKVGGMATAGIALLGLMTGGIGLIVAGPAFAVGATASVLALREFKASPYADEVYCLSQNGFKLVRNSDNTIVLRSG